ncbi:MAG: 3-deoxy-8-phosphooctulonate synthase [Acidobacteriota bacterium]|jgi:2-dehydro-3-deoxyphosphooctonate aldolase (KDO 8-P synthase)
MHDRPPLLPDLWDAETRPPLFLIMGPCVIESAQHCLDLAGHLKEAAEQYGIPMVFKASFDKANRTSIRSYRGPGFDRGLQILAEVRSTVGLPVTSDIHEAGQAREAAIVLDILQIPAFLCRQTDLLTAAAATGRPVNIKKGQFLAPWDVRHIVEKVESTGNRKVILTERGTSFGYNNLVVDFKGLPVMRNYGFPVVFDATHSVQLPGGAGEQSSGQADLILPLARAAVAVGVDGLFFEVHDRPSEALSDGANALPLSQVPDILATLKQIDSLIKAG